MRTSNITLVAAVIGAGLAYGAPQSMAVDIALPSAALDLTKARELIKAKDWPAAISELKGLAGTYQGADLYNLLGFSLRKSGDHKTALTYYQKALDFDPNHKGAREYLGELYVETKQLDKAKEQLAILVKLCPQGCEERADLEQAIAAAK